MQELQGWGKLVNQKHCHLRDLVSCSFAAAVLIVAACVRVVRIYPFFEIYSSDEGPNTCTINVASFVHVGHCREST